MATIQQGMEHDIGWDEVLDALQQSRDAVEQERQQVAAAAPRQLNELKKMELVDPFPVNALRYAVASWGHRITAAQQLRDVPVRRLSQLTAAIADQVQATLPAQFPDEVSFVVSRVCQQVLRAINQEGGNEVLHAELAGTPMLIRAVRDMLAAQRQAAAPVNEDA